MPTRRDGRIEPGQPLKTAISAAAWNRAQDAADMLMGQRPGVTAEAGAAITAPFSRVKVFWQRADSDETRVWKPFTWCVLNNWVNHPASVDDYIDGVPLFEVFGGIFGAEYEGNGNIAIALEPVRHASIGWAAVSGLCPCRVAISRERDGFHGIRHVLPYLNELDSEGNPIPNNNTTQNEGEWTFQTFPFAGYRICGRYADPGGEVISLVDLSSYWAQPIVAARVVGGEVNGKQLCELHRGFIKEGTGFFVAAKLRQGSFIPASDQQNSNADVPVGRYVRLANPYAAARQAFFEHLMHDWQLIDVLPKTHELDSQGRLPSLANAIIELPYTQP
jgi:hypothetical protein